MIRSLLCSFLFLVQWVPAITFAQEDYRDSLLFEYPTFRHEVFTNLTPPFVLLMAGESIRPRFSLGYRHPLKENSALRFWVNWDGIEDSRDTDRIVGILQNTNGYVMRRVYEVTEYRVDLRAGIEWFKPDQRITSTYGIDVFGGIQQREEYKEFRTYELDTTLCANCYAPSLLIPDRSESRKVESLVIGVDFSIGALFKASDRVWLRLQWTPEFYYLSTLSDVSKGMGNVTPAESGLYFHLRGVELFAGVRF